MNYRRIHDNIIQRSRERVLECYSEKHHIIPRCMNGSDDCSNLAVLTAREHFICHKLLTKIYPNNSKIHYAFFGMCSLKGKGQERDFKITSHVFEFLRENLPKPTDETKKKISNIIKELWKDDDYRKKTIKARSECWTDEARNKHGEKLKETFNDPKIREKMRQAKLKNPVRYWKDKKRPQETLDKMSENRKGKCIGETNTNAKLTVEKVKQIKKMLLDDIPQKIIVEKFNISRQTVYQIKIGKAWKHVT